MHGEAYQRIPLARIQEPSHRLRASIDVERLGALADSMAAEGLHQPIGLRGPFPTGLYEIAFGHRRFLAAQLLRWPDIAARLYPADFDPLLASVSENLQRDALSPIEEALAVRRFIDRGEPEAAIARLFRRSAAWVKARLDLLALPDDLRGAVHEGTVKVAVALPLADVDNDEYRATLLDEAVRTGASARTVEVWRAHYLSERERLVRNLVTVTEIAARREDYRIKIGCDGCGREVDYRETESWRFCTPCAHDLRVAAAEAAAAPTPTGAAPAA